MPSDIDVRLPSCSKLLKEDLVKKGLKFISYKDAVLELDLEEILKPNHLVVNRTTNINRV